MASLFLKTYHSDNQPEATVESCTYLCHLVFDAPSLTRKDVQSAGIVSYFFTDPHDARALRGEKKIQLRIKMELTYYPHSLYSLASAQCERAGHCSRKSKKHFKSFAL